MTSSPSISRPRNITNLTDDEFFDYGPSFSPDAAFLVYNARISGNQKLFRLDVDTKKKTQLTFGTNDETAAQFFDPQTLLFSSTATDPAVPLDPETAKNGNVYNIWTLDLRNGELSQYTDALGGNLSPIVLNDAAGQPDDVRHATTRATGASTRSNGKSRSTRRPPRISARPGRSSTSRRRSRTRSSRRTAAEEVVREDVPRRPAPVNVGVTNNGDVFGGTEIGFGDVLGDKQFNLFASSIAQYRTLSLSYVNLGRRFQYALQGYSQTQFFYGQLENVFYDPTLAPLIGRERPPPPARCAAAARSASTRSTASAAWNSPAGWSTSASSQRPALRGSAQQFQQQNRQAGLPQRHDAALQRGVRSGNHGFPRVRAAVGQHDALRVPSAARRRLRRPGRADRDRAGRDQVLRR